MIERLKDSTTIMDLEKNGKYFVYFYLNRAKNNDARLYLFFLFGFLKFE